MNLNELSKEQLIDMVKTLQRDSLTGFYKREIIDELSMPNYVIGMLDINGLKQTNDTMGHTAGDNLILSVVNDITRYTRKSDTLVRYGGDEFIIIFNGCTVDEAIDVMKRIENVSFGVGISHHFSKALATADAQMYINKHEYYCSLE